MANNNSGKNEKDLVCSFCGKHQDEVERMIIGPGVNICSECIGLCADLLSDKPDHPGSNSSRPSRGSASRARIQPADDLAINDGLHLRKLASYCFFYFLILTSIFFGCSTGVFGSVTLRMPLENSASIPLSLMPSGRVKDLSNFT